MKINKQLLEKIQGDRYDKAQVAAYKKLKSLKKAIAAIYAYTYGGKKTILDKPLIKYNKDEVQAFIDGFSKGKETAKVTIDVIYKDQLDKMEDNLKDRGLIENYKFKLKEAAEKEFDVTFSDGPTSNRSERTIIKAKDVDDATSKAYNMPQAKRYSNIIVGERTVGKTNYIVAFNYTIINSKGEEVKQPFKNESRMVIEAESESKAISVYNNKCLGKYFEGYSFRNDSKVLDKPVPGKQCGKFGRVFDCYQGGAVPRFKADESLTIEEDVDKDDDFYIKAGILATDKEIKEDMKKMNKLTETKSLIRYWAADKDNYDDGELFETEEEAIKHAESDDRWVKVYKGDFSKFSSIKGVKVVWEKGTKENKKTIKEADKPAAQSIEDCQKWVDYDMKHYGKISDNTNKIVKKAGFQIIKDDHGDYEVTAGKFEGLKESLNKSLKPMSTSEALKYLKKNK